MKNSGASTLSLFALFTLFYGCAHPYTLDPLGGKTEVLNGVSLTTIELPKCVFQAGFQSSNPDEMLVKVRVMNKEKAAFEVEPSAFALSGGKETLKTSPLKAADPETYLKDLAAQAELLESRTQMESYQGVEELGELKGTTSDSQIDAAKSAYQGKMKEAKRARSQADALRKRIALITTSALRKTNVKSGESAEGALVFKAEFGETGVVVLESSVPACSGKLQFMLRK